MSQVTTDLVQTTPLDADEAIGEVDLQSIKKRSIGGAVSYFLRTIFLNGIGVAAAIILGFVFSPEDFGLYGLVLQFIGILIFFSDIGLAAALIQKQQEPSEIDYATVFTVQQILSWAIVLVCVAIITAGLQSQQLVEQFPESWQFLVYWLVILNQKLGSTGYWIMFTLALSFPLAALKTIPSIKLERKLDFSKLVIPQIVEQISFYSLLIYLALEGFGAISYAYAIIFRSIFGVIAMYSIAPWMIKVGISQSSLQSLLRFGVKFQLNDALARIKDQLFFAVLGIYLPLNQFGYIQWAKSWSLNPYNLTVQNVMAITFPTFSRLQHNKEYLRKAIEKSLFFISLLIFPILVGMSVFITPLLTVVPGYAKWSPAIISLIFFLLDIAWSAIGTPLINALSAIGKINITLKIMILRTVLTWVGTPLAMYLWGFNGVAIATFVINSTSLIPIWYVHQFAAVDVWGAVWRQLLAAICMTIVGVLGLQYWGESWVTLVLGMFIASITYLVVLFSVGQKIILKEIKSVISK
jgi:O-antigen/teichoic acid export membrane protein